MGKNGLFKLRIFRAQSGDWIRTRLWAPLSPPPAWTARWPLPGRPAPAGHPVPLGQLLPHGEHTSLLPRMARLVPTEEPGSNRELSLLLLPERSRPKVASAAERKRDALQGEHQLRPWTLGPGPLRLPLRRSRAGLTRKVKADLTQVSLLFVS